MKKKNFSRILGSVKSFSYLCCVERSEDAHARYQERVLVHSLNRVIA